MSEALSFTDVMDNIHDTMEELDGEAIADIYNHICSRKIKYVEDDDEGFSYYMEFQYTGDDDNDVD
jgi:hypothetical protein